MGTFERIRQVSPYALGIFVVVFVGFMVISDIDFDSILTKNPAVAPIAKINGEEILYRDFEERVRQLVEQQRSQMDDPDADIDENQIRTQVWDQMISEVLMRQHAEKSGIKVTAAEIADLLIEDPPDYLANSFVDTAGNFNRRLYLELITNPETIVNYMGVDPSQMDEFEREEAIRNFRRDLLNIENFIRNQKLNEGLNTVVSTAGSQISPLFAKTNFRAEQSQADVRFIHISTRDIDPELVEITDQEVKEYYEKNKKYYRSKPQRKIKYLTMPIEPSADDSSRANRRVQKILEDLQLGTDLATTDSIFDIKMSEFSGTTSEWQMFQDIDPMRANYFAFLPERQVVGPVRLPDGIYFFRLDGRRSGENVVVKASHILVGFGTNDNKDSARAEANKILRRARSGEDFAMLAMTLSEDKGSGASGGDLGYFGKGRMVKPFEDAAFAANVGQIVGPVESQFGYHIIKVTDRKSEELQYSQIKIVPTLSNPTRNKIFMAAHSFVKQFEDGIQFDTLANRMGISFDTTDFIGKDFPIFGSWALTNQIFEAKIGTVLQPREIQQSGIVIIQVIDQRNEGISELSAVEKEIRQKILKRKQIDMLKDRAMNIYNQAKSFSDLSEFTDFEVRRAESLKNNGSVPGAGMDIAFTATIFKSETGKVLEPIRGETGWFIAQIVTKNIPDDEVINAGYSAHAGTLKQVAKSQIFNTWFTRIKQDAKIEDFRSMFYNEY